MISTEITKTSMYVLGGAGRGADGEGEHSRQKEDCKGCEVRTSLECSKNRNDASMARSE